MSLARLVTEYLKLDAPRREAEAKWWGDPKLSPTDAIVRAAKSMLPNDQGRIVMHGHQRRPGALKLTEVANALKPHVSAIAAATNFRMLHDLVGKHIAAMPGVGSLIVYDVAERIGIFLGLKADVAYLHAGAKVGAARLDPAFVGRKTLNLTELPPELQKLTAAQVEDFLCIYKSQLEGASGSISSCGSKRLPLRSVC